MISDSIVVKQVKGREWRITEKSVEEGVLGGLLKEEKRNT